MPRCASLRLNFAPLQKGTPDPELFPSKNNRKNMCANWARDKDVDQNKEKNNDKHMKGWKNEIVAKYWCRRTSNTKFNILKNVKK